MSRNRIICMKVVTWSADWKKWMKWMKCARKTSEFDPGHRKTETHTHTHTQTHRKRIEWPMCMQPNPCACVCWEFLPIGGDIIGGFHQYIKRDGRMRRIRRENTILSVQFQWKDRSQFNSESEQKKIFKRWWIVSKSIDIHSEDWFTKSVLIDVSLI